MTLLVGLGLVAAFTVGVAVGVLGIMIVAAHCAPPTGGVCDAYDDLPEVVKARLRDPRH